MNRIYRWQFHFNAMHNITPKKEEGKHTHSFLVILSIAADGLDLETQIACEKKLKQYLESYNGKYLNEMGRFQGKIPTIEVICETLYYDTEKIAAECGMHQVQIEVGDSPIALLAMGRKLMLGGTGRTISDEQFENYRQRLQLQ